MPVRPTSYLRAEGAGKILLAAQAESAYEGGSAILALCRGASGAAAGPAMIDLPAEHLDMVKGILAAHVPNAEVRAFGSRVRGRPQRFSDLDLVLVDREPIDRRR